MTSPATPTTMSMTPTLDRFIPLVDHVIANFRIAPIAIQHQTGTNSHQPASFIRLEDTLGISESVLSETLLPNPRAGE